MGFAILGMGTAVPATIIDQEEALRIARSLCCRTDEQATWLPTMYGQTGISSRHLVLGTDVITDVLDGTRLSQSVFLPTGAPDDQGPTTGQRMAHYRDGVGPLALRAARQALECSGLCAADITHLVTVSCTGFHAPGVDIELIQGLGLPATTQRTHLGFMGCHGAFNGLRVARAFSEADPSARALLCAVELCSLHYHYGWDPQKMVANALFADGAAAVVGAAARSTSPTTWLVTDTGSCVFPGSHEAMTWTISDHGFVMSLSKAIPGLIARNLRPWIETWLGEHHLAREQVSSWAVHPGGPRILTAVEEALELQPQATAVAHEVFAEYGNMSSPTILFIIDRLQRRRAPRPCVALGFGPGLTAEAVLFR
jgi:predicted naringenin-chalcone synthase